jgi:alkylation response protein AidB-like acyl-CoA dehydrogenase
MKAYANIEAVRLTAERVEGGYVVTGSLPWVSNLGSDHFFGAIFTVPGHDHGAMALVRCDQPGVKIAQRSHFCALEGTRTMTVILKQTFISDSHLLADPVEPYLVRVMPGFVLLQTGMALGLIQASIDAMHAVDVTHRHINAFLPDRPQLFEETLEMLGQTIKGLAATPYENSPDFMRHLLETRLAAAEWSLRAANAAMLHAGTRGYLIDGSAQRRLREAYFIAIVTPSIKHLRKELADIAEGGGCMRLWKRAHPSVRNTA